MKARTGARMMARRNTEFHVLPISKQGSSRGVEELCNVKQLHPDCSTPWASGQWPQLHCFARNEVSSAPVWGVSVWKGGAIAPTALLCKKCSGQCAMRSAPMRSAPALHI